MKRRKRLIALMLAFTMAAPSTVWADTQPEIDVSALRVSDQFAAKHPNGMFEVLSPMIQTGEGKEFDFYVLRRGGTEGKASVKLKAVEISAKYGEDFILQEKDALGFYHNIEKIGGDSTLLEKQVEMNKDVLFTTDRVTSGMSLNIHSYDELTSGAAAEVLDVTSESENARDNGSADNTVSSEIRSSDELASGAAAEVSDKTSEDENAQEGENVQEAENAQEDSSGDNAVDIDSELSKSNEAAKTE